MNKKIIILSTDANSLINFRYEFIKSLKAYDYDVVACAPFDNNWERVASKLNLINVRLLKVVLNNSSFNPIKDLFSLIALCKLLKQEAPTCIFNYFTKSIIYGSLAASFSKLDDIYSMIAGLGYAFTDKSYKRYLVNSIVKMLYRISLKYNKKIFFQNKDDVKLFLNNNIVKKNQVVLINGSGVDTNYFNYTVPPKLISFLFVGRLLKDKGIYEYFNAAKKIKLKYPHVVFNIAGEITSNPSSITKQTLKNWQKSGVIEYLGFVKDIRKALHEASIFVLPSYREGIPRSGLEALSVGRPIITTNAPGCKEIVQENYNGYLVPIKNDIELAKAMEKLILNPVLIINMGINSRKIAVERFNVHEVNKMIINEMI